MSASDLLPASGNVYDALRAGFPADRGQPAVELADGRAWTWDDLDQASAQMARLLASLDPPPAPGGGPPRLLAQVEASPEALLLLLAALRAGWVHQPLDPDGGEAAARQVLGGPPPTAWVCSPAAFPGLSTLAFQHGVRQVFTLGVRGEGTLVGRAAFHPATQTPVACAPDQTAVDLAGPGQVGPAATLGHAGLLAQVRAVGQGWGGTAGERVVHALPVGQARGFVLAALAALRHARPLRGLDGGPAPGPQTLLDGAGLVLGTPARYQAWLADPGLDRRACARLRRCLSGPDAVPAEIQAAWEARTGHRILAQPELGEAGPHGAPAQTGAGA